MSYLSVEEYIMRSLGDEKSFECLQIEQSVDVKSIAGRINGQRRAVSPV